MAGLLMPAPDAVGAEIVRWASEPFDMVSANCGISVAGYAARVTGQRVPRWLNAFGRLGVARLMRGRRAFLAAATRAMADLGCPETDAPERGDVGMVDLPGTGLTACICAWPAHAGAREAMWIARGDGEALIAPGVAVKAWRVACRRP